MLSQLLHITQWIDFKSLLVFSTIFLLLFDYFKHKTPRNFPPGPWSLPFLGDLHHINFEKFHMDLERLAQKYGKIFSIRLFGSRLVMVNGYSLVKKVYVDQGDNISDRPAIPLFVDIIGGNKGLVASNGHLWKQQRRFALSTLRNFGLGKKSLEPSILQECNFLSEAISNEQGRPFDPQLLMNNAVANVISVLVFGERFDYNDDEFQNLLKKIHEAVFLDGGIWAQVYNMVPWIMRLVPGPHHKIISLWNDVIAFIGRKIKDHRADYDALNQRDYIDCFLAEMEKWKDDEAAGFDMENLSICTLDLFGAGTETSSTTLYWGLLYMIKYPDIQAKVQAEISRVVGSSRQPSIADRENLPFTNAVLHEIQRFGNIIPMNVPRVTGRDTQIEEYFIPKGTMLVGSLTSVLFDESEWETPWSFNPAHFLDANGNFRKRDAFMPFSSGRRVCLGEQLARMELFLFFTSLMQRFTFSPPEGVEPSLQYKLGATHSPRPYKLCAVPR